MEPFICASEIPLVFSAIGVSLTDKFWADNGNIVIYSFDISRVSVIVNPLILSDVTNVSPDFWDVNSLTVWQVFQESPVCLLKLF